MRYWLPLVFAFFTGLLVGPAWGQAELSTIISPATFPISPAAGTSAFSTTATGSPATVLVPSTLTVSPVAGTIPVTASGSPTTVICAAGCASAGASPSTVVVSAGNVTATGSPATALVPNTVAISPAAGTSAFSVTATGSPATVVVAAQATLTVSPVNATIPVSLTGNAGIGGTLSISPAAGVSAFSVTATGSPASVVLTAQGTLTTSPVNATIPVSMSGPVSLVAATIPVSMTTGVSLVTATIPVSMSGPVSLAATTTVSIQNSSLGVPVAEQNAQAYPNRANWITGSITTSGTANNTVINAPAAGKNYITFISCGRTDASTSGFTVGFNAVMTKGTSFNLIVPQLGQLTNYTFNPPLTFTGSVSFTPAAAVVGNSLVCNVVGFNNP